MTCIECGSRGTRLRRGDDGHFRRQCDECGHEGGPYVSGHDDPGAGEQAGLGDFA